jgi:uncharacterized protein (DUF1330 family)
LYGIPLFSNTNSVSKFLFIISIHKKNIMAAYIIVDVTIYNESEYALYRSLTPATIEAYDGRFVVRGGKVEIIEGEWNPGRLVILEFPTAARAKEWWNSPEYSAIKNIRYDTAKSNMILVEGASL